MMIRTIIFLFVLGLPFLTFSQADKFDIEFSINPNVSSFFGHIVYLGHHGPTTSGYKRLSYNMNVNLILAPESNISPTLGLTYLNIGHHGIGEAYFYPDISEWTQTTVHQFIVMPTGVRLNLGRTFISPELGIGTYTSSMLKNKLTYVDGSKETISYGGLKPNPIVLPIFFTIGHELPLKSSASIVVGIRTYIVPDVISDTYYGYGLFLGVQL